MKLEGNRMDNQKAVFSEAASHCFPFFFNKQWRDKKSFLGHRKMTELFILVICWHSLQPLCHRQGVTSVGAQIWAVTLDTHSQRVRPWGSGRCRQAATWGNIWFTLSRTQINTENHYLYMFKTGSDDCREDMLGVCTAHATSHVPFRAGQLPIKRVTYFIVPWE